MPTILSATRMAAKVINNETVTSKTLIDNIIINYDMEYQSDIIETGINDHYSIINFTFFCYYLRYLIVLSKC